MITQLFKNSSFIGIACFLFLFLSLVIENKERESSGRACDGGDARRFGLSDAFSHFSLLFAFCWF